MQSSPYNNPLFAQGLSGLVQSFIGNPKAEAQNQLYASEALLNNQTAQYREAMDVGLRQNGGDLGSMMIRALQAGPEYSGNAPKISNAVTDFYNGNLGTRRGGGGGGGSAKKYKLGAGAISDLLAALPEGTPPDVGMRIVSEAQNRMSQFDGDPYASMASVLENLDYEETVTNPAGTVVSRMLGMVPEGAPPDATEKGPVKGVKPLASATPEAINDPQVAAQAINQAREAISRGADPKAVAARLVGMGIDPGAL